MSIKQIAVLGGGNGSLAAAADLTMKGFRVRLWSAFPQELAEISRTGKIRVTSSQGVQDVPIDVVTDDPATAIRGAQVIVAFSPAFAQPDLARAMGPYLEDGQVVFLSPGSLGGYLMGSIFKENGWDKNVILSEPGTLPYLARKEGPDRVTVSGRTVKQPVGVYPASKTDDALERLIEMYPEAHPVENAVSVALLNVGPIIHSVLFMLNVGPIEHFPSWDIHNEGTTPLVKKTILAHDGERIRLREAFGFISHHYPFSDHYDQTSPDEWMYGRKAHTDLVKSENWRESLTLNHRYIQEDVKRNLVLLTSLAKAAGIDTPIASSLVNLYSTLLGENLFDTGRSLDSLGLGGKSAAELMDIMA